MAIDVDVAPADPQPSPAPGADGVPRRPKRRRLRMVLIGAGVVVALLVAAGLWFFLGREQAEELSDDQALVEFRARSGAAADDGEVADASGRPTAGVYAATATGTESIGLPGFDERLGPNAPVTVTHGDDGCYSYRADFNSHHWRSWTFCGSATTSFALTRVESFTARKAPGLDTASTATYACDRPVDLWWAGAAAGDERTGACTGTTDLDDSVTADAVRLEVLDTADVEVDGRRVPAVRVRTTDTFSGDQQGTEVGNWWLDARTGLPLRIDVESGLTGGASDYSETFSLRLTRTTPAT